MNIFLCKRKYSAAGFLLLFFVTGPFAASIKCWTNKDGVKECGDKIPPEYSQGASTQISKSGIVIKEEAAAKSIETIKKERQTLNEVEASRKADQVLLNTFASVNDLILARNSKTEQIDKEITLLESRIKKLGENLDKIKDRINKDGDTVAPHLENLEKSAEEILSQMKESQEFISTKAKEKKNISAQFEQDISRFQELIETSRN